MGNTLWIQTRSETEFFGNSDDLSWLYHHSNRLDKLCKKAKVAPISDFIDQSYIIHCYENEDGEAEEDPVTKLSLGVSEMEWFDLGSGINTLEALHRVLDERKIWRLSEDDSLCIRSELQYCLDRLRTVDSSSFQFNLEVLP